MMLLRIAPLLALAAALAGCGSSPPVTYHALSVPVPPPSSGGARVLVEFLPVAIPERLNRKEMVLGGEGGAIDVRDNDHWAAPLADEIRQIVVDDLWQGLRAVDVYQAPPPASAMPQYRLALRMERFEAVPGRSAVVDGTWTMRRLPNGAAATCRAGFSETLSGTGAGAAAEALSQGTQRLAEVVTNSLGRLDRGETQPCP